jgi:hypothetical protein
MKESNNSKSFLNRAVMFGWGLLLVGSGVIYADVLIEDYRFNQALTAPGLRHQIVETSVGKTTEFDGYKVLSTGEKYCHDGHKVCGREVKVSQNGRMLLIDRIYAPR